MSDDITMCGGGDSMPSDAAAADPEAPCGVPARDALAAMRDYPPVRVTVLGSGTSTGVPVIGCSCAVCTSTDPRNKRLRSSIKVEAGGLALLIDCGVDFRQQMLNFSTPRLDAVLLTHNHADHIHGLDDLRAYCFRQGGAMPIYSTRAFLADVRNRFGYCFVNHSQGGGVPRFELTEIRPGEPFIHAGLPVLPIPILHGRLPILGYRFGRFAYLTDCSGIPEEGAGLLKGVDHMIISGLRHKPHSTHFNFEQSMEAAARIGIGKIWFIHMTCSVDHETTEAGLPDWARLTYDGMELEVR